VFIALIHRAVEAGSDGLIRTPTSRRQHSRERFRRGSDLTDHEWEIIAPSPLAPKEWVIAGFRHTLFRPDDK
jgi:hypothetical protein